MRTTIQVDQWSQTMFSLTQFWTELLQVDSLIERPLHASVKIGLTKVHLKAVLEIILRQPIELSLLMLVLKVSQISCSLLRISSSRSSSEHSHQLPQVQLQCLWLIHKEKT